jgi:hypothetical protein
MLIIAAWSYKNDSKIIGMFFKKLKWFIIAWGMYSHCKLSQNKIYSNVYKHKKTRAQHQILSEPQSHSNSGTTPNRRGKEEGMPGGVSQVARAA